MPNLEPLREGDPAAVGGYRLVGRLGAGGQGVVYLGRDADGRPVAVKVLREGMTGGRFAKEIAAARRVDPFCVAQVLDASLGGRPYIVSEYVEGPSLQQTGPRAGADLQRLAVSTATALTAIHQAGIVHRDFKPANVLLGRDGPRVIDFGIARAADAALTVTSGIVGTPAYMAPEQLAGAPAGPPADVFAWACVIVFAATGAPPFGDDTIPAVISRILTAEPWLGDLPEPLRSTVYACLSKEPAARPAMQAVLLALLSGRTPAPSGARAPLGAGVRPERRARRTACMAGRAAGSLERHAYTVERSGSGRSPSHGSAVRMRLMTAGMVSSPNGGAPVAAKTITQAQAKTSAGGPAGAPASCSGAMYAGVPTMPLVTVSAASAARAMPKSMTRGPSRPSSTLAGLKSRCTMPAWWMAVSAVAVLTASRCRSAPARGPVCCSEGPSTYSLTMYGLPPSEASSTWATQNGSTRRAAAISLANRPPVMPSRSTLTATGRPSASRPR